MGKKMGDQEVETMTDTLGKRHKEETDQAASKLHFSFCFEK
jgi:hypothetical protein